MMGNGFKIKISILIFTLVIISCVNFAIKQSRNDRFFEIKGRHNLKTLKGSNHWNLQYIHIDGNWSQIAGNYTWCQGEGSWKNPYLIENVTIDASNSPTGSGIIIFNSNKDYFIINNCTIHNAHNGFSDAGLGLINSNNGILMKNNCSNNSRAGIILQNCENITILENFACRNNANFNSVGIRISASNKINISRNIVNNNGFGIALGFCINNTVSRNVLDYNGRYGIYLYDVNHSIISENYIRYNDKGIDLYNGDLNIISQNEINYNKDYGIFLLYSDYNIISENNLIGNKFCIYETSCTGNIFENNYCDNEVLFILVLTVIISIAVSTGVVILLCIKMRANKYKILKKNS